MPRIIDIRNLGLVAGIELEPRPGAPGVPAGAPPAGGFDLRSLLQPIRFESSKRQASAFRQVPFDAPLDYTFGLHDPRDTTAFADDAQNLSDGELFYIIENGVRLTGMPGFGSGTLRAEGRAGGEHYFVAY